MPRLGTTNQKDCKALDGGVSGGLMVASEKDDEAHFQRAIVGHGKSKSPYPNHKYLPTFNVEIPHNNKAIEVNLGLVQISISYLGAVAVQRSWKPLPHRCKACLKFEDGILFGIWVLIIGILTNGASVGKKRTCHQSNPHLRVGSLSHSKIGMTPMVL